MEWPNWWRFLPSFSSQVVGRIRDKRCDVLANVVIIVLVIIGPLSSLIKNPLYAGKGAEKKREEERRELFSEIWKPSCFNTSARRGYSVLNLRTHRPWRVSPSGDKSPPRALHSQGHKSHHPNFMATQELLEPSSLCRPPATHDIEISLFWCGHTLSWRYFDGDHKNNSIRSHHVIVPGT